MRSAHIALANVKPKPLVREVGSCVEISSSNFCGLVGGFKRNQLTFGAKF